jgi:hypothetical protein
MLECNELESLLAAYLEGDLDAAVGRAARRHIEGCARCAELLNEVTAIVGDARDLPALTPSRDLWPEIEARIQADVVPLGARSSRRVAGMERVRPRWLGARLAAAAAALVLATAGITYVAATRGNATRTVAAGTSSDGGSTSGNAGGNGTTGMAVRNASTSSSEQLYDREIAQLQTIVGEHSSLLDSTTVAVIQRNLVIIDSAIAESRAALAADPNSRFLNDQLNSVLDQKVELLRTAALLPART